MNLRISFWLNGLKALLPLFVFAVCALLQSETTFAKPSRELRLKVVDADTSQPVAVRVHLKNSRGRIVIPKAKGIVSYADHFLFEGEVSLKLSRGKYTFEMEAGPEYKTWSGHFEILRNSNDEQIIKLHRFANLAKEGWYASDMYVARKPKEAELLMKAEGLSLLSLVAKQSVNGVMKSTAPWKNEPTALNRNRWFSSSAALWSNTNGTYLSFHHPFVEAKSQKEIKNKGGMPFSLFATNTKNSKPPKSMQKHIDVADPTSWALPVLLSQGTPDSFELISFHSMRHATAKGKPTGYPKDKLLYPGDRGQGRWAETIYYHLLNCGFRVPPSAGTGSGNVKNPAGINRVYVHCEGTPTYKAWWKGLQAGHVFVSNGPLLRATVEDEYPGKVFNIAGESSHDFFIALTLSTRRKIEYLQIIKNGEVEHEVRLDAWVKAGGKLPPVHFEKSGWFLVRAVTDNTKVYQFASTGPFYVEISSTVETGKDHTRGSKRISESSVRFFQSWLTKFSDRKLPAGKASLAERKEQLHQAEVFWAALREQANAD